MARKSFSLYSSLVLLFLGTLTVLADNKTSGNDYKDFSVEREFIGKITPLTVTTIPYGFNDEYRGKIYTIRQRSAQFSTAQCST